MSFAIQPYYSKYSRARDTIQRSIPLCRRSALEHGDVLCHTFLFRLVGGGTPYLGMLWFRNFCDALAKGVSGIKI